MGQVTLSVNGATFTADTDECETVDALLAIYERVANIPAGSAAAVNGETVPGTTRLSAGDRVSVNKPTGSKG